jgi:RecA/RadA recombinase
MSGFNQIIFIIQYRNKQRLHVKKITKVFKFNQIIFIIRYRNKQRLHVKKNKKVFKFNQIIFIIQYRNFHYRKGYSLIFVNNFCFDN